MTLRFKNNNIFTRSSEYEPCYEKYTATKYISRFDSTFSTQIVSIHKARFRLSHWYLTSLWNNLIMSVFMIFLSFRRPDDDCKQSSLTTWNTTKHVKRTRILFTGAFHLSFLRFLMGTARTTMDRKTVCAEIGWEELHTVLQNIIVLFVLRWLIFIDFVKFISIWNRFFSVACSLFII